MPDLLIRKALDAVSVFLKRAGQKNFRSNKNLAVTRKVDWSDFLEKPRRKVKDASDEVRKASR